MNDPRQTEQIVLAKEIYTIILDLDMPHRHGLEVLESIQEMDGDRRVIYLTGEVSTTNVINAANNRAEYIFFKTNFSYSDLAEAIHSLHFRRAQWYRAARATVKRHKSSLPTDQVKQAASAASEGLTPVQQREYESKFLLSSGKVDQSTLDRAIGLIEGLTPRFLNIAVDRGILGPDQAIELLIQQQTANKPVGELAIELGLLGPADIAEIIRVQDARRPTLAKTLAALGVDVVDLLDWRDGSDSHVATLPQVAGSGTEGY